MYPELVAELWSKCEFVTYRKSLIDHVELNSEALWFVRAVWVIEDKESLVCRMSIAARQELPLQGRVPIVQSSSDEEFIRVVFFMCSAVWRR